MFKQTPSGRARTASPHSRKTSRRAPPPAVRPASLALRRRSTAARKRLRRLNLASRTRTMPRRCPCTATLWAASLAVLAATRSTGTESCWWSAPRSATAAVTGVGAFLSCSAPSTCGSSAGRARLLGANSELHPMLQALVGDQHGVLAKTRNRRNYTRKQSNKIHFSRE